MAIPATVIATPDQRRLLSPSASRPRSGSSTPSVQYGAFRHTGRLGAWRSLVARTVRVGEVPGSNPGAPIDAGTRSCSGFRHFWARPSVQYRSVSAETTVPVQARYGRITAEGERARVLEARCMAAWADIRTHPQGWGVYLAMPRFRIAMALVVSAPCSSSLRSPSRRIEISPRHGATATRQPEPEPEAVPSLQDGGLRRPRAWVAEAGSGRGPTRSAALGAGLRRPGGLCRPDAVIKVLAVVDAGAGVTLAVPEAERQRLSLLYDFGPGPSRDLRFSDGTSSVRFRACARSGRYPGRETQFNGGFFVRGAHCAAIEIWTEGRTNPRRRWLPFGVGERRCPPRRA